jgi:hypothetical protein
MFCANQRAAVGGPLQAVAVTLAGIVGARARRAVIGGGVRMGGVESFGEDRVARKRHSAPPVGYGSFIYCVLKGEQMLVPSSF